MSEDNKGPYGLWDLLSEAEDGARKRLAPVLQAFEEPFRMVYECGVEAPTLPSRRHQEPDLQFAGLFLKRALTDFRVIWVLVHMGYTAQAASVAASLYEHALAVDCIAGSPKNAQKLSSTARGELPWSPKQLAHVAAKQHRMRSEKDGYPFSSADEDAYAQDLYTQYVYFCKLKHPTSRSLLHLAAALTDEDGAYVIGVMPDVSLSDGPLKAQLLLFAAVKCVASVDAYVNALDCEEGTEQEAILLHRLYVASERANRAFDALSTGPLPFTIGDDPRRKDWLKAKEKQKASRKQA
jgi:hypothetical protein